MILFGKNVPTDNQGKMRPDGLKVWALTNMSGVLNNKGKHGCRHTQGEEGVTMQREGGHVKMEDWSKQCGNKPRDLVANRNWERAGRGG